MATNAAGQATFEVTDAAAEVVLYRATDTTDDLPLVGEEVQVTFGTPPPTAPSSPTPTLSPAARGSGRWQLATIEVILNDANGLPLGGKTVTLVPSSVNAVVSPATASTGSTGRRASP